MLFYINKNSLDTVLVKKCIKNLLTNDENSNIFDDSNKDRIYPNQHLYDEDPKIHRNKQIWSLEFIIRLLFSACLFDRKSKSLYLIPLEVEKKYQEIKDNIKNLTRHFVLLYICKNGKLIRKVDYEFCDKEIEFLESEEIEVGSKAFLKSTLCEVNPLIFLDIV